MAAFHLKLGQGAKTGIGGHLPGIKVRGRIVEIRGLPEGTAAVSPATFTSDLATTAGKADLLASVRDRSGGIPVGVKMSAQHMEADLDAALALGVDYVILDGRCGGTGAAPKLFRDNISVPTIPSPWPTHRCRRSGAWGCGHATRATARWGSPPKTQSFGSACRLMRRPSG